MISRVISPFVIAEEKNSHGLLEVVVAGVTSFELTNSPYLGPSHLAGAGLRK